MNSFCSYAAQCDCKSGWYMFAKIEIDCGQMICHFSLLIDNLFGALNLAAHIIQKTSWISFTINHPSCT